MELIFGKSPMGQSESALTPEGIKITLVHRTKSLIIVYYGKQLIAECKTRQEALDAVSAHVQQETLDDLPAHVQQETLDAVPAHVQGVN